jgi:hypothetical protein
MESGDSVSQEATLQCPSCRNSLRVSRQVDELDDRCPVCNNAVRLEVFPRFYREPAENELSKLADDSQAKCNFYPELPAEKVCDECGCFLSEKASVKWGDLDLCLRS